MGVCVGVLVGVIVGVSVGVGVGVCGSMDISSIYHPRKLLSESSTVLNSNLKYATFPVYKLRSCSTRYHAAELSAESYSKSQLEP